MDPDYKWPSKYLLIETNSVLKLEDDVYVFMRLVYDGKPSMWVCG